LFAGNFEKGPPYEELKRQAQLACQQAFEENPAIEFRLARHGEDGRTIELKLTVGSKASPKPSQEFVKLCEDLSRQDMTYVMDEVANLRRAIYDAIQRFEPEAQSKRLYTVRSHLFYPIFNELERFELKLFAKSEYHAL
jgi:hypothetical protein